MGHIDPISIGYGVELGLTCTSTAYWTVFDLDEISETKPTSQKWPPGCSFSGGTVYMGHIDPISIGDVVDIGPTCPLQRI
jgi:hypothetical protein